MSWGKPATRLRERGLPATTGRIGHSGYLSVSRPALATWIEPDGVRGIHRTSFHVRVVGRARGTKPQSGQLVATSRGPRNEPLRACRWAALDARGASFAHVTA